MSTAIEGDALLVSDKSGCEPCQINVPMEERIASGLAGGALVALGLTRGSWGGLIVAAAGGGLLYRGVTGHCMLYQMLGIDRSGFDNPAVGVRAQHGYKHEATMVISKSAEELYHFWRNLENLPLLLDHLISVEDLGMGRSHWVARAPVLGRIEWDAEIINDREGELIAWRSIPGSELDTAGTVQFQSAPGDRGAILKISMKYDPPGGKAGATLASLLGAGFEQTLAGDLRQLKQRLEAGETPTVAGQPRGACRPR